MYFFVTVFPLLACLIRADLLTNTFIYPRPAGPVAQYGADTVWPIGSQQTIQWTSNFSEWILEIYHNNGVGDGSPVSITSGVNTVSGQQLKNFTWTVETDTEFHHWPNNTFWLSLDGGSTGYCQSHYVNLTVPVSSTTTSASTTSATSTSSSVSMSISSTTTAAPLAATTTAGPIAIAASSTTMQSSTKILIGVTVPIALFAMASTVFLCWRRVRAKERERQCGNELYVEGKQETRRFPLYSHEMEHPHQIFEMQDGKREVLGLGYSKFEMENTQLKFEMENTQRRLERQDSDTWSRQELDNRGTQGKDLG